jgi:hypothetical protein
VFKIGWEHMDGCHAPPYWFSLIECWDDMKSKEMSPKSPILFFWGGGAGIDGLKMREWRDGPVRHASCIIHLTSIYDRRPFWAL